MRYLLCKFDDDRPCEPCEKYLHPPLNLQKKKKKGKEKRQRKKREEKREKKEEPLNILSRGPLAPKNLYLHKFRLKNDLKSCIFSSPNNIFLSILTEIGLKFCIYGSQKYVFSYEKEGYPLSGATCISGWISSS